MRPMPNDDRDAPGDRLIHELRAELAHMAEQVDRMSNRLEEQAVMAERIENNRQEIERLRETVDAAGGVLDRLATVERVPDSDQTGGLFVSTGTIIAFVLFLLGAMATAFWRIIDWLRDVG